MLKAIFVTVLLLGANQENGFDISGIKIGMSGEEVKSSLASRGFVQADKIVGYSYQQKLARMVASNKHAPLRDFSNLDSYDELQFSKQSETIYVAFQQTRSGPVATDVKYSARGFFVNRDDFKSKAKSKFGIPSLERDGKIFWCHIDANRKCDVSKGEAVILNANDEAGIIITLTGSNAEQGVGDVQLRQDVQSQSGIKPSF